MSRKILTILLIGVLVLGITAVALAAPRQFSIFKDLNLSDNQYDEARKINEDYFEKMNSLRNEYAKKSYELNDLILQKNPDEEAIQKTENELLQIRNEIISLRDEKINESNKILTDEQARKLDDLNYKKYYGRRFRQRGYGFGSCGLGLGYGLCRGFGHRY